MRIPKSYITKLAAAVTKRCGICTATVEQVLPAVFDEIRCQLVEQEFPCIPIESFGTFGVIVKPERDYNYSRKGVKKLIHLKQKKVLKFYATRNLREELEAGRFDPSRQAFTHHPDDPPIRRRKNMVYQPKRKPISKDQTVYR